MILRVSYLSLLLAGTLVADSSAGIGFGEPKVLKLDWSTRSLQVQDLNGDGLQDMAVINNDTAQIELLYQLDGEEPRDSKKRTIERDRWEPVLSDAGFDSDKITIGFPVFDLGVGDLNNDGFLDLAYTARDVPLTIRFQNENGQWLDTQEFDGFDTLGWNSTLKVSDIDGDGRADLVLLAGDAVRVFSQDDSGKLQEAEVYFVTGENPFNLEVVDVTGDGLGEICYITTEGKQSLVLREQLKEGGFGAERRFIFDRPVRMFAPISQGKGKPVRFSTVDSRSGALEFFDIKSVKEAHGERPLEGVQAQIYPVFKMTKEAARYSFADLDGDGEGDLQVANPEGSELMVFMKENGRFQASKSFPTFSGISSLSGGRFFREKDEAVIALSRGEKTLGVSRYDKSGRLSFPRLIQVAEGEPLVCEAINLDGDEFDELALIQEGEDGMQLVVAKPAQREKFTSEWEIILQIDLPQVRRKPEAIRALDVFGARGVGLMLFVPREPPVFLASAEGSDPYVLEVVAEHSSIRESLLKEITPAQVSEVDVDGDGHNELVAARAGFARALSFDGDSLEMVDQFNSRRSSDQIAAIIPSIVDDVVESLVLYVPAEGELQFLVRDDDGVLRYRSTEKVGTIDLSGWLKLAGKSSDDDAYILFGEDRFWYFAAHANSWKREVGETYETDLEDIYFSHVQAGDFSSDGKIDIIAIDGNEHVVEILTGESGEWQSQMYWEIFEQNMHYQGRSGGKLEPRQTVIADLNGDGRLDFAFLIHDRIIYYPQE